MSQLVTERSEIAQRYAEAGVVMMRQLLSPAEVTRIRDAFTDQIERTARSGSTTGCRATTSSPAIRASCTRIGDPTLRSAARPGDDLDDRGSSGW